MWSKVRTIEIMSVLICSIALAAGQEMRDEVSYSNDIKPLVDDLCPACHAGDDPEGGFVLTSYADVRRQTEKGKLLMRINYAKDPCLRRD